MPLYEYQCDACGHRFERIQKFSDDLESTCPECGGSVRKLLSSPAIQFKGSGMVHHRLRPQGVAGQRVDVLRVQERHVEDGDVEEGDEDQLGRQFLRHVRVQVQQVVDDLMIRRGLRPRTPRRRSAGTPRAPLRAGGPRRARPFQTGALPPDPPPSSSERGVAPHPRVASAGPDARLRLRGPC